MSGNGGGARNELGPKPDLLLTVSRNFLNSRNFDACRKYALRAQSTDPNNTAAAQLLAVADVLSSAAQLLPNNTPNWYSILGLEKTAQHPTNLVKTRANALSLLLTSCKNETPLADEAFELVKTAWAVLSDPVKKARFDSELGVSEPDGKSKIKMDPGQSGVGTFWTLCPYCYYVYEYPRVYEEFCLRCHNERCGRAFQAVEIRALRPPTAVVEKGEYFCLGFVPVGSEEGGSGSSSWSPFGPGPKGKVKDEVEEEKTDVAKGNDNGFKNAGPKGNGKDELKEEKTDVAKGNDNGFKNVESCIEISDDSDDELLGESSGKKVEREGLKNVDGIADGCSVGACKMGVAGVLKPVLRRKKTVARNTKKVMGKGIRVKMHRTVAVGCGEVEMGSSESERDSDCGVGMSGGVELGSWGDSGMKEIQCFDF